MQVREQAIERNKLFCLQIGKKLMITKLFSPPYVLAPQKDTQSTLAEACGERTERSGLLLCGYCLSDDQRWLLGVVTDDRGEILETCTINIHIPNRNRRRKASARKIGLAKLFDFLIGVMSNTTRPWRLVVGRFGRIGHGELKGELQYFYYFIKVLG